MKAILPGATVGVLGGGQLGRMFAIAARRMGYRVHTFSPDSDTPAGQVSDREFQRPYDDLDAVREFARGVEVVTFEFENVPAEAVEAAAQLAPVRPSGAALYTTQHRLREKTFLSARGFPLAPFRRVDAPEGLRAALEEVGCPAVLKTAGFGYDGKGQTRIDSAADAAAAFAALRGQEGVVEAFVDFEREVSVVAARGAGGEFAHYGLVENTHSRHILDLSVAPARVDEGVAREAVAIARAVLEELDVVGVTCVEFFLTGAGRLLVNELAPRPHNSGHWTADACAAGQFEQLVRAVCGLPLGDPAPFAGAVMENLIGDDAGRWPEILAEPGARLHLYGKREVRPGRKMGHVTRLVPLGR